MIVTLSTVAAGLSYQRSRLEFDLGGEHDEEDMVRETRREVAGLLAEPHVEYVLAKYERG